MEHGSMNYDKSMPNSRGLIIFLLLFVLSLTAIGIGIFYLTKVLVERMV